MALNLEQLTNLVNGQDGLVSRLAAMRAELDSVVKPGGGSLADQVAELVNFARETREEMQHRANEHKSGHKAFNELRESVKNRFGVIDGQLAEAAEASRRALNAATAAADRLGHAARGETSELP